jgi:polyferredoxin
MRRVTAVTLATSLLVAGPLPARPALAHGFGQSYDLPLPLWLYLYGAAAAVLVSFIPISLFAGGGAKDGTYGYPRFDLLSIGPLRLVLTSRVFLFGVRLLSVFLFVIVILGGFIGRQSEGYNFAPTFVWIVWWVGFSFFSAFVGNFWPLMNPWKILFEWADGLAGRLGRRLELDEPYPEAWGVWPAVALYTAFVWIELVFYGAALPLSISLLVLAYSVLTWSGMALFGKDAWLRGGEAFSVYFNILGRFAPTEVRVNTSQPCLSCDACAEEAGDCVGCYECFASARPEDRELNLRPPAIGLARAGRTPAGGTVFVVLMLAGVAYDGLLATPLWLELVRLTSVTQTMGLFLMPLSFLAIYLGFVKLSQIAGGGSVPLRRMAPAYVYTLVPIAIAYQVAHYYTYLLIQGQAIIYHMSDPFGWGWNLFGTAGYEVRAGVVSAAFVWYSQVALIVTGHILAVYLAHVVSLRFFGSPKLALRSQLPMLVLMILYTIFSLWILSQPIVSE